MSKGLFLGGLISGMSTNDIIQQILDAESVRIKSQETRKTELTARQTAWQDVRTSLNALRSKLDTIRFSTLYQSRKATATNDSVATFAPSSGSALTSHSLDVRSLASTHVIGGAQLANPNSALGYAGDLTIAVDGVSKTLSVTGQDTLNSLRDKINGTTGIGVNAQVVKIVRGATTSYQLVLTSKTSGAAGQIQMSATPGLMNTNPAVADATGTTAPGPFDISVTKLAEPAVVESDLVDPAAVFAGSFTINGVQVDVNGTIADVEQAINTTPGVGVTAAIAGGKLQLTSQGSPNAITFGNVSGTVLQDIGMVDGTLAPKNVVTDPHAMFSINGVAYTSDQNSVSNAGGIAGLNLTLLGTGSTRVGQLEQVLGFKGNNGDFSNVISAGADAHFFLNNVEYNMGSNTLTDILPGLSITLKGTGTTTATVTQDGDKVADAVQQWVDAVNSSLTLLKDKSAADPSTRVAGPLNADSLARQLQGNLRKYISNVVGGLPITLNNPSQIGITTGAYGSADYGKILFDKTVFKAKLLDDPDGVAMVLGAKRNNVAVGATITPVGGDPGYDVASITNGDTDPDRFGSLGGGWQSSAPTSSITFSWGGGTKTIDQALLSLPDSDGTTGIKDFSLKYEDANGVWHDITSVTNHQGASKLLTFEAVTAKSVRLDITGTYGGTPARITELQLNEVNNGAAIDMYRFVDASLNSLTGSLSSRDETISKQVKAIDDTISKLNDSLTKHEQQLRMQFARMESALSKLRMQGDAFTQQMMGLMGAANQNK